MAEQETRRGNSAAEEMAPPPNDESLPASMPPAKRVRSAPTSKGVRPATGPRRSTLLGATRRRVTHRAQPIYDTRATDYYLFDHASAQSDSSSDEEGAQNRERRPAEQVSKSRENPDTGREHEGQKHGKRGGAYNRFMVGNEHFHSKGRVSKRDGRLNLSVNETSNTGYLAKVLGQSMKQHLDVPKRHQWTNHRKHRAEEEGEEDGAKVAGDADSLQTTTLHRPKMNIVIMVIGSRGDIQPFLKLGKILKEQHGHRVRVATHPTFRDFVHKENGLEFFSVGGDPAELMAFMVKNPGMVPTLETIRENEIHKRRESMAVMFEGFWRACIRVSDDERDREDLVVLGDERPFVADAIIANPPSMAHVHIAEKLGVPLHMMFTFPYTPTQQFPHPLASIKPQKSNVDANYVNFMSFGLVEMMTWQGLGDIVNKFRERTLGLEPVSSLWAPGALYRMHVPYTYLWSPSLIPKPKDWGLEIDIAGFVFLDLASTFQCPPDLRDFLEAGEPPIYVGFGSIVVDDPNALTEMIFAATKRAGVRALVNKGWGGFGASNADTPAHIFMLENTPHDWLFPRVRAVVHHGGAGTTAIGLKCAKPTMIVPFFGDQQFWGAMVSSAKAGAHECVAYKNLTVDKFTLGIQQCLGEEARTNVRRIAERIAAEGDGAENAVESFHRSLPLAGGRNLRCSLLEDRVAVWQLRKSALRLSPLAAELLHQQGKIKWADLKLCRHYEWNDFDGPGEPITGTVGAVKDSLYDMGAGVGMVPIRVARHIRKHEAGERKRLAAQKLREERRRNRAFERRETEDERVADGPAAATAPLGQEIAEDFGAGFKRAGGALLTFPTDLGVALAQGFHNAPRLWGDATVRKPVRITGFKSGCVAARREFTYGVYDGWSGLVTQPLGEWRDGATMPGKLMGLGLGFGKGLGGFVLKNVNAVVAPPAYFSKGVVRYVEKHAEGPGSKVFVRRAQIIRGELDLKQLRDEDRQSRQGERSPLRSVEDRVMDGFAVFEQLWREANSLNRYEWRKEKRTWEVNGGLENQRTAQRALEEKRKGGDLGKLWRRRRKEMRGAEAARAPAMEREGGKDGGVERSGLRSKEGAGEDSEGVS
ncbi:hypothetical protein LTR62_008078 [Meristemomyces frigidus]|uniref:Glycosyltransferase family 28 N-terminal domain-containing protein n=1 Tax=Meristemomyces frigidus TaxID=1508187 RepID=A0AAN7T9Y7_9PEZI|nr:hypothetical protein LTR62_008078 [Meristemomyces frigidus]